MFASRRTVLATAAAALATPALAATPTVEVIKGWGCACCDGWVAHMRAAGFKATVTAVQDLSVEWRRHGVPDKLSSCHMARVGGYVTVGHVPVADVRRLLKERPRAIGIVVPAMPYGSPGMERPDGKVEPYATLLLLPGGQTRVFARHG